jgi:hypothetical protein
VESLRLEPIPDVVLWDVGLHPAGAGGRLEAPELRAPVLALVPDEPAGEGALSAGARGLLFRDVGTVYGVIEDLQTPIGTSTWSSAAMPNRSRQRRDSDSLSKLHRKSTRKRGRSNGLYLQNSLDPALRQAGRTVVPSGKQLLRLPLPGKS